MDVAGIPLWVIAVAAVGAALVVWIIRERTLRSCYWKALEYSGHMRNNFERFAQGREPSDRELLDGIKRQPEKFLQRMRFMSQMLDIEADDQAEWLEEIERVLAKFLAACEGGYKREAHALPLHSVCSRARALAKHPDCPEHLREPLRCWSREVITWRVVTGRLVAYLQRRIKEDATYSRG